MLSELNSQKKGFKGETVNYVGRKVSASPAAGTQKMHQQEQKEILDTLFSWYHIFTIQRHIKLYIYKYYLFNHFELDSK